jgi:putative integral membrane protein (TIGR02587 family)
MLFTLEMWQVGSEISPGRLLALLWLTLAFNFPLSYFSGFKGQSTFRTSFDQAVSALALGAAASAVLLVILNRIQPGDSAGSVARLVIIQAVPLSLGASVANALFSRTDPGALPDGKKHTPWRELLNDLGGTAAGAVFLGFSIAPTEEVVLLALEMRYLHEIALLLFSLLAAYIIVFESGFSPLAQERGAGGFLQHPATETVVTYVLSLGVAALALYFFGQISWGDPMESVLSKILVLGLPAAIGGAAGRLVI